MAWYDALFTTPDAQQQTQEFVRQIEQNPGLFSRPALDPSALENFSMEDLSSALVGGVSDAITDPNMYMDAIGLLGGRLGAPGSKPGVNSIRNSRPNWVWGEAGKGGKGWRWGDEGKTLNSASQQVRAIPQQKGGLPATQGGLPATVGGAQGGLPATQGGLPALMSNKELATLMKGQAPGAAAGGAGRTPFWATVLGGGGVLGMDAMFGPEEPAPEQAPLTLAEPPARQPRGPNPWDALVAQAGEIGSGDVRPFQTLPTVDYQGMARPDFAKARSIKEENAPDAPAERSFMQDLHKWVIPALGGGILGGPLGLILGGLMGEGGRQTGEQERDAAYQERLKNHNLGMADFDLAAARETRGFDQQDASLGREAVAQDYRFGADQRTERRDEAQFVDQRSLTAMQKVQAALAAYQTGQSLDRNQLLMDALVQGDPSSNLTSPMKATDIMSELIQLDPSFAVAVTSDPTFMAAQGFNNQDPRKEAAIVEVLMRLRSDPQWGPYIQAVEQKNRQSQIQKLF